LAPGDEHTLRGQAGERLQQRVATEVHEPLALD
jgi:hypothetical protein